MKKHSYIQMGLGMDIAKSDFSACIMGFEGKKKYKVLASSKFSNTPSGFEKYWSWSQKHLGKHDCEDIEYLMEATGVYHENLAWFLYDKSVKVVVALPSQAKDFMKGEGIRSKTDKIDAQGLAKMVLVKDLRAWQPISSSMQALRSLTRHHETIQKDLTQSRNRLHALDYSHNPDKFVAKQLKAQIKFLEKQRDQTHDQIEATVKEDEKLHEKIKHLTSIHGVGLLTAAVVVAETNGFELFTSEKQLTSYAGYDIVENESGTRKGKTKISKQGNAHIRRILCMPAFNAINVEGVFLNLYNRVFERTKEKMKGYTAVQRKLLCMMYTLWKKDEDFDYSINNKTVEEQNALLH
ncbi:IS110 family RNA-guided transposase [Microscilla marina]|uniref:Transposase for n=1 Tax=Microscilla marina ATCC 23134 TaxID=313606 RepID=A1ZM48_MICM2|nr:IS110 family transposase [Microscilla marina]EAY26789.1 transposase for [Microscilla marina ATCC 23134]EAY27665.1 transposase for [Microscilla marina ATCC 23134]EAY28580.1 transposase for [Microscilla marina ATCC 23134]